MNRDGVPTYLDASSPRARDLYQRHGYTLLPGGPFRLPGGAGDLAHVAWNVSGRSTGRGELRSLVQRLDVLEIPATLPWTSAALCAVKPR